MMKTIEQTDAFKRMQANYDGLDIVLPDTKVMPYQEDCGYAIELRGFYTLDDLVWIVRDLKKLNDNRDTGE